MYSLLFLSGKSDLEGARFIMFDGACSVLEELAIKMRGLCSEGSFPT